MNGTVLSIYPENLFYRPKVKDAKASSSRILDTGPFATVVMARRSWFSLGDSSLHRARALDAPRYALAGAFVKTPQRRLDMVNGVGVLLALVWAVLESVQPVGQNRQ